VPSSPNRRRNRILIVLAATLLCLIMASGFIQTQTAKHHAESVTVQHGELLLRQTSLLANPMLLSNDRVSLNYLLNELTNLPYIAGAQLKTDREGVIARAGDMGGIEMQQALSSKQDSHLSIWLDTTPFVTPLLDQLKLTALFALGIVIIAVLLLARLLDTRERQERREPVTAPPAAEPEQSPEPAPVATGAAAAYSTIAMQPAVEEPETAAPQSEPDNIVQPIAEAPESQSDNEPEPLQADQDQTPPEVTHPSLPPVAEYPVAKDTDEPTINDLPEAPAKEILTEQEETIAPDSPEQVKETTALSARPDTEDDSFAAALASFSATPEAEPQPDQTSPETLDELPADYLEIPDNEVFGYSNPDPIEEIQPASPEPLQSEPEIEAQAPLIPEPTAKAPKTPEGDLQEFISSIARTDDANPMDDQSAFDTTLPTQPDSLPTDIPYIGNARRVREQPVRQQEQPQESGRREEPTLETQSLVSLLRPDQREPLMPSFQPSPPDLTDENSPPVDTTPDLEETDLSGQRYTGFGDPEPTISNISFGNLPNEEQLNLYSMEHELELVLEANDAGYCLYIDTSAHAGNVEEAERQQLLRFYTRLAGQTAALYNGNITELNNGDVFIRFDRALPDDSHGVNAICAAALFNLLYKGFNQSRIRSFQPALNLRMALARGQRNKEQLLMEEARFLTHTTQSNDLISHTALTEVPVLKDKLLQYADIRRQDEDKVLILSLPEKIQALLEKQAAQLLRSPAD